MLYLQNISRLAALAGVLSVLTQVSSVNMVYNPEPYSVDATYDFGKWDENFVKCVAPGKHCNLIVQTTGTTVSL
jgi:hypothetical protein